MLRYGMTFGEYRWYSHSGSGSLGSLEPTIHLRFRFTGNCATYGT